MDRQLQGEELDAEEYPANIEEEARLMDQELHEMELLEAEQYEQQLEQHSQRAIDKQNLEQPQGNVPLQVVKNPVSPYMMFVKSWKGKHPDEKFNMSALGGIWKNMSLSEKQPYEEEYREKKKEFDEYQAAVLIQNPEAGQKEAGGSKYLFPLHRVRSIMKQDAFYSAKVEATAAMAKATEYFAQHMLEEIKKMSEGKNRIDAKVFYDCINNQRTFSFLECLIEQHNRQSGDVIKEKKSKPQVRLEFEDAPKIQKPKTDKKQTNKKPAQKASTGQMSLDSFVIKQR